MIGTGVDLGKARRSVMTSMSRSPVEVNLHRISRNFTLPLSLPSCKRKLRCEETCRPLGSSRPVKSVDNSPIRVLCRAPIAFIGAGPGPAHSRGGWIVRRDTSLPAIGLMVVLMVFSGRSLVQAASRQQAGSAKQTAQRVMSLSAQAPRPSGMLPLSLMESIALALEGNFDIIIEGFNPKIQATNVVNEQAEFDPETLTGFSYSGGKEQLDDAPFRWPPDRTAKVRISTPLVGVEQRLQLGTRLGLQVSHQHIRSNETASTGRFV